MTEFHPVRAEILYQLRHTQATRFSQLMKHSGLESDAFKFHTRALKDQGYITKGADGLYALTAIGKEVANNLDQTRVKALRQPKLSICIVVSRVGQSGTREYLVQQRKRQPFYDYWGCLSGPAQWGEDFEVTAQAELTKQCGLTDVPCQVRSFYRQRDYLQDDTENTIKDGPQDAQNSTQADAPQNMAAATLLEDKLFVIVQATVTDVAAPPADPATNFIEQEASGSPWPGGTTQWMTLAQLQVQQKVFDNSRHILQMVADDKPVAPLRSGEDWYKPSQY